MAESDLNLFDDPELKAAIRRAVADESAPASLRNRVQNIFADTPSGESKPATTSRSFWRRSAFFGSAAAAIFLCVGLLALHFRSTTPALPDSFASDLVVTHDHCCSEPDHHFLKGVPDDDFRLMTQKLREQLGFPALAVAAGDGWKFYGASAICMVGNAHSAHLVFKQNGQSLSLFSVAVSSEAWPADRRPTEGERFANMQAGHPIASWVHDDTVYSVVGASPDGSLNLHRITPFVDRLAVALSGEDTATDARVSVASR